MKFISVFSLAIVCLSLFTALNAQESSNKKYPKVYIIHIDQNLENQYQQMHADFAHALDLFLKYIRSFYLEKFIRLFSNIFILFQSQVYKDLVSMWSRITHYSENEIILANLAYELLCTSIIIRNKANLIFMGRNLDFPGRDILANLTYIVDMRRNNQTIYYGEGCYGGIGLVNGIAPGRFAISLNQRYGNRVMNIARFFWGYPNPIYFVQEVLETAKSYDEAFQMIMDCKLSAASYMILSGVKENEGVVIARSPYKPVLVDRLSETEWFLVQTNYDRNLPDPVDDYRRIPVENEIRVYGNSMTFEDLYDIVLSRSPCRNEWTIYSAVLSASPFYFNSTIYINNFANKTT